MGVSVTAEGRCHEPPSASNATDVMEKLLETWDRAQAVSRATLRREIRAILRGKVFIPGTEEAAVTAASRATFGL